jgi:hypothetical protein
MTLGPGVIGSPTAHTSALRAALHDRPLMACLLSDRGVHSIVQGCSEHGATMGSA